MRPAKTPEGYSLEEYLRQKQNKAAGKKLLSLIRPGSVAFDAWDELEKGRANDRLDAHN
jgi:hypothetical protein